MPQSLSQIYFHLIFSTKDRQPLLHDPEIRARAHAYLAGTLKSLGCTPLNIGGVADHAHSLFEFGRVLSVADLVKDLKIAASKWAKSEVSPSFAWQRGYGCFSVSRSNLDSTRDYILGQEEHHRHRTFQEEYRLFLRKHGVTFNEAYVWD